MYILRKKSLPPFNSLANISLRTRTYHNWLHDWLVCTLDSILRKKPWHCTCTPYNSMNGENETKSSCFVFWSVWKTHEFVTSIWYWTLIFWSSMFTLYFCFLFKNLCDRINIRQKSFFFHQKIEMMNFIFFFLKITPVNVLQSKMIALLQQAWVYWKRAVICRRFN